MSPVAEKLDAFLPDLSINAASRTIPSKSMSAVCLRAMYSDVAWISDQFYDEFADGKIKANPILLTDCERSDPVVSQFGYRTTPPFASRQIHFNWPTSSS